jgi:hypothetical protein
VIVGVSAGLKLMVVAVFATLCGWLLIWVLERQPFGRLQVRGLPPANIPRSAEAYRKILLAAGCRLVGERKRYTKGVVSFVFVAPAGLDREVLEQHIYETVAEDIRGVVDWEVA